MQCFTFKTYILFQDKILIMRAYMNDKQSCPSINVLQKYLNSNYLAALTQQFRIGMIARQKKSFIWSHSSRNEIFQFVCKGFGYFCFSSHLNQFNFMSRCIVLKTSFCFTCCKHKLQSEYCNYENIIMDIYLCRIVVQ